MVRPLNRWRCLIIPVVLKLLGQSALHRAKTNTGCQQTSYPSCIYPITVLCKAFKTTTASCYITYRNRIFHSTTRHTFLCTASLHKVFFQSEAQPFQFYCTSHIQSVFVDSLFGSFDYFNLFHPTFAFSCP